MTTNDQNQHPGNLLDALRTHPSQSTASLPQQKLQRRLSFYPYRKAIWLGIVCIIVAVIISPLIAPLKNAALSDHNWIIIGILLSAVSTLVLILISEADSSD